MTILHRSHDWGLFYTHIIGKKNFANEEIFVSHLVPRFPHRFKPFQLETVMLDEDQVVIYNSKKAKLSMAPFLERAKVSTVHTGVGEQPQRIMGAAALEQRRRLRADEQRIFNGREFEKRGEGAVKRFPIIILRLHVFTSAKPELCCS